MAEVLLTVADGVALLALNRPERRNAMSSGLVADLIAVLADLPAGIGAVVLTGMGSGFCAGSDLKGLAAMTPAERHAFEQASGRAGRALTACPVPTIAAVHGFAMGGGLTLAACCDIVVSASDARWSLPEVPVGLFPAWGLGAVTARTGTAQARRLSFGIDTLSGDEARAIGLADVISQTPLPHAQAIAAQLTTLPRTQVAMVKRYFGSETDCAAADARANDLFLDATRTDAAQATFARFAAPSIRP